MIIVQNRLTGLLPGKFPAMCIWPFILIKPSVSRSELNGIIRHESIHARQQVEMLWIFFFLWYLLEFTIRVAGTGSFMKAYKNLAHEREAYLNDDQPDYLKHRKLYAWIRYL